MQPFGFSFSNTHSCHKRLRQSQKYKYNRLVELKGAIHQESESCDVISRPIRQAIRELDNWRKVWLSDKKRWDEWQSSQQKDGDFEQLRTTVEKANKTITTALEQILSRMGEVLALQERGGGIQDEISAMTAPHQVQVHLPGGEHLRHQQLHRLTQYHQRSQKSDEALRE